MGQGGERGRTAARGRGRDQREEGDDNGNDDRRQGDEADNEEAKQRKKAQETSFDVSWAVGKFFFSCFPNS